MVKVHAGESHNSVAEGNCVAAKQGGEQPKANCRSAGKRTRFGGELRRACSYMRSPKIAGHAGVVVSGDQAAHVVGGGTTGRCGEISGETCVVGINGNLLGYRFVKHVDFPFFEVLS